MEFWEKLLPNQPEYTRLWGNVSEWPKQFAQRLDGEAVRWSGMGVELAIEYPPGFPAESMSSHPATLRLVQILLKSRCAVDVLEIGTFVGRSAIWMAKAGCRVTTVEKHAPFAEIASRNIVGHDVRVILGDAMHTTFPDASFDAVFIDGDKEHYLDYFLMAERALRPRGMVLVDDCFFHGDALNGQPTTAKGRGVKRFMDHAATLDGWLKLALPLGNGLMIMVREWERADDHGAGMNEKILGTDGKLRDRAVWDDLSVGHRCLVILFLMFLVAVIVAVGNLPWW